MKLTHNKNKLIDKFNKEHGLTLKTKYVNNLVEIYYVDKKGKSHVATAIGKTRMSFMTYEVFNAVMLKNLIQRRIIVRKIHIRLEKHAQQ